MDKADEMLHALEGKDKLDELLEELEGDFAEQEMELSYSEIMASLMLNGEIVIVIPMEAEAGVKTGLKNLKAKQALKLKEEGLIAPEETLEFESSPSTQWEDCVSLKILLKKKGVVKVMKMTIPDGSL